MPVWEQDPPEAHADYAEEAPNASRDVRHVTLNLHPNSGILLPEGISIRLTSVGPSGATLRIEKVGGREGASSSRSRPYELADVCTEAQETVARKNRLYGDAWLKQGWRGNLARVLSKADRLRNVMWRTEPLPDAEELSDETAVEMITLLAMFIVNKRNGNEWGE